MNIVSHPKVKALLRRYPTRSSRLRSPLKFRREVDDVLREIMADSLVINDVYVLMRLTDDIVCRYAVGAYDLPTKKGLVVWSKASKDHIETVLSAVVTCLCINMIYELLHDVVGIKELDELTNEAFAFSEASQKWLAILQGVQVSQLNKAVDLQSGVFSLDLTVPRETLRSVILRSKLSVEDIARLHKLVQASTHILAEHVLDVALWNGMVAVEAGRLRRVLNSPFWVLKWFGYIDF